MIRETGNVVWIIVAFLLLSLAGASPGWSQGWLPVEPAANEKDWVQLSSGEWIRGSIDLFRDLKMEFDSDDLDDLEIDWEDITAFRSPRILTFVFTHKRIVTGTSSLQDRVVRISTGTGIQEFPRSDLLSIIEGKPKEINFWAAKVNIDLSARSGNTDQNDLVILAKIKREATRSRLNILYEGNHGEFSGERTIENHQGNFDFNIFVSRKFYITPAAGEIYTDEFLNIDYRAQASAGGGYYFFRQSKIDWSVGLSGGYKETQFISVEAGEDQYEKTGTIVPTTKLETDITKDIELTFDYTSNIGVPDTKSSTHHMAAMLTVDLFGDVFEMSTSLTWDRDDNPTADEDGIIPKKEDIRLAVGFAIDL
jgi:hypothetical protein